jgi:hypothetical protein
MNTKIAQGQSLAALQKSIDALVADGYRPVGSITRTDDEYSLVMQFDDPEPLFVEYAADGAIAPDAKIAFITKPTAGAFTLAAPQFDGQQLEIYDTTAQAHTVVTPSEILWHQFSATAEDTITFNGVNREGLKLTGHNGQWIIGWTGGYTVN